MNEDALKLLLKGLSEGRVSVDEALSRLKTLPFEDLGFAVVDHHRALRQGVPEVVWGEGKTPDQLRGIATSLRAAGQSVLVTRLSDEGANALSEFEGAEHFREARCVVIGSRPSLGKTVAVVSAGTSDRPVAEEARVCARALGLGVISIDDVGVAGLHRLLGKLEELRKADAILVVAGMEGALPSVVTGLVSQPVIAVPTSVGYGSSFEGLTALLGMLNSCASGLTVVNIDNGFGAAMAAFRMLRKPDQEGAA